MKNIVWTTQAVCLLGIMMLVGCMSMSSSPLAPSQLDSSQDQVMIQALHKRLHERERTIAQQNYQIEVMSSQLEALKRIDQDMRKPRRPMRNSMIVTP
jgi:TolA-binding protein